MDMEEVFGIESKHDRFVRIAQKRTNQVMYRIRVLSNLGNRYNYDYSTEEVEQIFRAIEAELALARAKFDTPRGDFVLGAEGGEEEG